MSDHEAELVRKNKQFRIKERWELLKYQKQLIPHVSNNCESNDWSEEREREFVFSLL